MPIERDPSEQWQKSGESRCALFEVYGVIEGSADNIRFNHPLRHRHTRVTSLDMEVRTEKGSCGAKVLDIIAKL